MKYIFHFFILYVLVVSNLKAQDFKLKLVEDESKRPVCFAYLLDKVGVIITQTNENGIAFIKQNDQRLTDSITIYCMGYVNRTINIKQSITNPSDTIQLLLKPKRQVIEEVKIIGKERPYETIKHGFSKKSTGNGVGTIQGSCFAVYLPNEWVDKSILLNSINGYFLKGKRCDSILIHFYLAKAIDNVHPPEVVFFDTLVYAKGGRWLSIDIEKYHIRLPESGIFIMMERLFAFNGLVLSKKTKDHFTKKNENNFNQSAFTNFDYPSLAISKERKGDCWSWDKYLKKDWIHLRAPKMKNAVFDCQNGMVFLNLKVYK